MPSLRESRIRNTRRWRGAALILAGVWLALLLGIGMAQRAKASPEAPWLPPLPIGTGTLTATYTPTSAATETATPTATVDTATPSVTATAGTPTGTVTATATGAATATATSGSTGGGGSNNYGDPSSSAEPTKVVFTQPTSGSHDNGPLQGLTPGAFTSNGLLLATSMSCIVTVLGVIVAVVAMSSLLRGGYGPFLRALALGKRAGGQGGGILGKLGRGKAGKAATPDPAESRDDWALSEELGALSESYKVPARAPASYGGQRPAPPQARNPRQPPSSRGRGGW